MIKSTLMRLLVLACIPLLTILLNVLVRINSGPGWLGYKHDPDYVYLLNSLNLLQGNIPGHYDHPGTPLQVSGAAIINIGFLFRNQNTLVLDVLKNPEIYLDFIAYFSISLIGVTQFLIGGYVLKITKNIRYSLLIQATPFLSTQGILDLHRAAPEPLLFAISLWLAFLFFKLATLPAEGKKQFTGIIAIFLGLVLATKINTALFIIVPLFILPIKEWKKFFFFTTLSFLFFTLPTIANYQKMVMWIYELLIHAENYGEGAATVIKPDLWISNLIKIMSNEPFLILIIGYCTFICIRFFNKRARLWWYKLVCGLTVYFWSTLFFVGKHFSLRYLISSLGMLGITTLLFFLISKRSKLLTGIASIVMVFNFNRIVMDIRFPSKNFYESSQISETISRDYQTAIIIHYYGASTKATALRFADTYANNQYSTYLTQLYPNVYYYDFRTRQLFLDGKVADFPTEGIVLMRGSPFRGIYKKYSPNIEIEDIFRGRTETIYHIHVD